MTRLKVGLIGCGMIARLVHLPLLRRLQEIELVAVADSEPLRLAEAKQLFPNAGTHQTYEQLLDQSDVEAVIICLPTDLHAAAAEMSMQKGKHVYLEKPLATSLAEGNALLETWQRTGVLTMIGFNYRFNPLVQAAREQVVAGTLGDIEAIRTTFVSRVGSQDWKRTRGTGGGVLLDLASHHIDLIRFIFSQEIVEVSASLESRASEDDNAWLKLRLNGGLSVQSFFSTTAAEEDRLEIDGTKAKLIVDRQKDAYLEVIQKEPESPATVALRKLKHARAIVHKKLYPHYEPSYQKALSVFFAAVNSKIQVHPDLEDGLRSLSVIEAAERSASSESASIAVC